MKKIILSLAIITSTLTANAQGSNVVKINPLSLVFSTINLSYERLISNNVSLQLQGIYFGAKISDTKLVGLGISPAVRFYLSDEESALSGLYVSPFLRYGKYTYDTDITTSSTSQSTEVDYTTIGGGFDFGYQVVTDSGFIFEAFLGARYANGKTDIRTDGVNEDDINSVDFDGILPRFGLKLGYSF
ncbi:MAG: DUF3575 domain-containing protein [Cyclobacteriaceae bacterium]